MNEKGIFILCTALQWIVFVLVVLLASIDRIKDFGSHKWIFLLLRSGLSRSVSIIFAFITITTKLLAGFVIPALATLIYTFVKLIWDAKSTTGGSIYFGSLTFLMIAVSFVAFLIMFPPNEKKCYMSD
uniref:Uncharacterized protein n=1 Tax=Trichobilharzia regenti TaxID=157069 RepID=A0AA85J1F7_TRIRE|nr:unnamed protein product [Trichobilharzia regenti]